MKKFVSLAIAGALALGTLNVFAACKQEENPTPSPTPDPGNQSELPSDLPVYAPLNDPIKDGIFTAIFGDPAQITSEAYKDVKDCNIRYVFLDGWYGTSSAEKRIAAMEKCAENGLKAYVMPNNTHDNIRDGIDNVSFEDFDGDVDYTQYPAFAGYYMFDEPARTQYDWLSADLDKWNAHEKYKNYDYLVNMMYGDGTSDFDTYITEYGDKVLSKNKEKKLMYDYYPLAADIDEKAVPYLGKNWLKSLEDFSQAALKYNAKLCTYIQTLSYDFGKKRAPQSVEDIRFQCAVNMAYGSVGLECFTYLTFSNSGFGDSMVGQSGEKTPIYYYVQQAFGEILAWENVYMAFDYQGTMAKYGTATGYGTQSKDHIGSLTYAMESHPAIKSIANERDTLIGAFKDQNGNDGFLITTYADPYYRKTNTISVEFNGASRALVYKNGGLLTNDESGKCYLLENGKLNLTLNAGDMIFAIPVK